VAECATVLLAFIAWASGGRLLNYRECKDLGKNFLVLSFLLAFVLLLGILLRLPGTLN